MDVVATPKMPQGFGLVSCMATRDELRDRLDVHVSASCPCGREIAVVAHRFEDVAEALREHLAEDVALGRHA